MAGTDRGTGGGVPAQAAVIARWLHEEVDVVEFSLSPTPCALAKGDAAQLVRCSCPASSDARSGSSLGKVITDRLGEDRRVLVLEGLAVLDRRRRHVQGQNLLYDVVVRDSTPGHELEVRET